MLHTLKRFTFHFSVAALLAASLTSGFAHAAEARPAPDGFADIVEKLMPAVVNISTTQKTAAMNPKNPQMPQLPPGTPFDDFYDFFERFGTPPGMDNDDGEGRKVVSLGSGFIVDPSGYIVTNSHVISEAEEITVIFSDDTQLKAKLIGTDSKTDLALLKVNSKKPLPSVKFGNSNNSRVGEWVIAIGNPFGLGGTVTAGIISARARDINAGPFDDFIQTDASINKGNSGGPMFNMQGEVIGINTAIYSPSGGSVGIGFATPSSLAGPVIEQLRKSGKIHRAWLGVKIQNITDDIAENMGLPEAKGALVAEVTKGSPADKAGIQVGDIILSFDGKDVALMRKLPRMVAETAIGKKAQVVLLRGGEKKNLTVVLGEMKEASEEKIAVSDTEDGDKESVTQETAGIVVSPLTASLKEKLNITGSDTKGVVVVKINHGSEAARSGIQVGDLILQVGMQQVTSPAAFAKLVKHTKASGKKTALLLLKRRDETQFIPLPVK